jgi:hypothetical protein
MLCTMSRPEHCKGVISTGSAPALPAADAYGNGISHRLSPVIGYISNNTNCFAERMHILETWRIQSFRPMGHEALRESIVEWYGTRI